MKATATGWQSDGSYVPCPECQYVPPTHDGPGIPVRLPGTIHNGDCPTVPRLSKAAEQRLGTSSPRSTDAGARRGHR